MISKNRIHNILSNGVVDTNISAGEPGGGGGWGRAGGRGQGEAQPRAGRREAQRHRHQRPGDTRRGRGGGGGGGDKQIISNIVGQYCTTQGCVRLGGARLAAHSARLDTALQTGLVTSHPGHHLQLHSPTRSLRLAMTITFRLKHFLLAAI